MTQNPIVRKILKQFDKIIAATNKLEREAEISRKEAARQLAEALERQAIKARELKEFQKKHKKSKRKTR